MKKSNLWTGILAITLVFTMAITACGGGDDGGDNNNNNGNNNGTGTATAPAITTTALPDGKANTEYSQTLTATGSTPITWSVDSGALPTGLTLAPTTGIISGTPTTENTFTFTVKATNAAGSNTKELLIVIGTPIFTSVAAFRTWLTAQPDNTAETAYSVKLNVSDLGGDSFNSGSAGGTIRDRRNKYVTLDLSENTFTSFPSNSSCGAFERCSNLTGIIIPNSVTSIGFRTFYECTGLSSVIIPNNITSIENIAFEGCTSLIIVTFQGTITSAKFESRAFGRSGISGYIGDLRDKYLATGGGIGTYTRNSTSTTWTKQN